MVSDKDARAFYEQEAINCNWSVRELKRQIQIFASKYVYYIPNKEELIRQVQAVIKDIEENIDEVDN